MIKTLFRFSLLLALCALFVYAPEILTSVSAPYASAAPERVLLRIVLCCDGQTANLLNKTINAYQKEYPAVHLRITQISDQQLPEISSPYPDVVLCPQPLAAQLPSLFAPSASLSLAGQALLCAVSAESNAAEAAVLFASYIDVALAQQIAPPKFSLSIVSN